MLASVLCLNNGIFAHVNFIHHELWRSGQDWVTDRNSKEAERQMQAMREGTPLDLVRKGATRKYRLTDEYFGTGTSEFSDDVTNVIYDPDVWTGLPVFMRNT